jgi:hypothetical protein
MQAGAEHREVLKEHAAVKSCRAMKKRHRGWHLAAERRGEPKEKFRGNCGSWKKLVTARRGTTRDAGVAWGKVHAVRKNQARENPCGTDVRQEMSAETGKHQRNRDTRLKEATISEKREDI